MQRQDGSEKSRQLFCAPGPETWAPALFVKVLGIPESEIASALGVHESVMRLHPGDAIVQKKLGFIADVFGELLDLGMDAATAAHHMMNTPIRVLNQRTLFEAIRDNESAKALRYLQTVSSGQAG